MDRYEIRLVQDNVAGGAELALPSDGTNRVLYVAHGIVTIGGRDLRDDQAWHGRGAARIVAGSTGAALWRWELAPAGSAVPSQDRGGIAGLELRRELAWPIAGSSISYVNAEDRDKPKSQRYKVYLDVPVAV